MRESISAEKGRSLRRGHRKRPFYQAQPLTEGTDTTCPRIKDGHAERRRNRLNKNTENFFKREGGKEAISPRHNRVQFEWGGKFDFRYKKGGH